MSRYYNKYFLFTGEIKCIFFGYKKLFAYELKNCSFSTFFNDMKKLAKTVSDITSRNFTINMNKF